MNKTFKSAYDKIVLSDEKKNQLKGLYNIQEQKKENTMKKFRLIKPVAAVAVCLSIALLASVTIPKSPDAAKSKANNYFTLTAYAEELSSNNQSKYNESSTWGGGMCETDEDGVAFNFEFPIKCEGENIDTVTYSINHGAFQISGNKEAVSAIQGEKSEYLNTPGTFKNKDAVFEQYRSFTLKYDEKLSDSICLDIVDTTDNWSEVERAQLSDIDIHDAFNNGNCESLKKLSDILVKNMDIKCTVKYKDGTTDTKNIVITNSIAKSSEVLNEVEKRPEDVDFDIVVRTYSIKE